MIIIKKKVLDQFSHNISILEQRNRVASIKHRETHVYIMK